MFIDASALVAVLAREPGHEAIESRLETAETPLYVSPLSIFEAVLALARKKSEAPRLSPDLIAQAQAVVDAFVEDLDVQTLPITEDVGRGAAEAAAVYGKVVGHAADLNFGDCFAYACARALDTALLYKGADFARTDLA